jgi:hypothetical protein
MVAASDVDTVEKVLALIEERKRARVRATFSFLLEQATAYFQVGDWARACDKCIDIRASELPADEPTSRATCTHNLASALQQLGCHGSAVKFFRDAYYELEQQEG